MRVSLSTLGAVRIVTTLRDPARNRNPSQEQRKWKSMAGYADFFWQLDTQIIFWEFALSFFCKVKIPTKQGKNIKCSMLKKGQSITSTFVWRCSKTINKECIALQARLIRLRHGHILKCTLPTLRINLKLSTVLFISCSLYFMHSCICQLDDT